MTLVDDIKLKLKPNYVLEKETYLYQYLTEGDRKELGSFINNFAPQLQIPSAIIAVGSSVFPKEHWDKIHELNKKDPNLKAPEKYQDIDLLIVPKSVCLREDLEATIRKLLDKNKFPFEMKKTTLAGVSYCPAHAGKDGVWKEIICPFVHFDYGMHSLSTKLPNGTKMDLIIGRADLINQTAAEKIEIEKKYKNPISVLYN